MASLLVPFDEIDAFRESKHVQSAEISDALIDAVRSLDEREEFEPFIRAILSDSSDTPHGPAEIADILTHKLIVKGQSGLAAFILKGKSFKTVRPKHVAHQIYRLEKIAGLRYAALAASGTVLDAAKEQFVATAERLGAKYSIFDAMDLARLFVAYGFLCPRDARRIIAGRCRCGYSPSYRILNILQQEALRELEDAHSLEHSAGLVVLPPGSNKTRIAAQDAKAFKAKSVLYVAHTDEILDVAESEFDAVFRKSAVFRTSNASNLLNSSKVTLATIQLLSTNLTRLRSDAFDYIIIDEFHHAAASTYRRLLRQLRPDFLLGLTATPFRGDRQNIVELCGGNILIEFELRTGIESGILSPYHYFGCFDDVDYSKFSHNGTSYNIRDLEKALIVPERDEAIAKQWRKLAEDKPTLAFCCSHKHAERMRINLSELGIPTEVYLSTTARMKRDKLTRKLQDGEIKILCTVDVLNEGADFPFVECLLFLRPTDSKRVFFQQLGRGLRKYVGKSHCIVVDFIGNFQNAYRIVDYQGLNPDLEDRPASLLSNAVTTREIFNLPLGCEVHFDEKVIDLFARQTLDPRRATRHNIGRILIYQYEKLQRALDRRPSKKDVDRYALLNSGLYSLVFGSWKKFEELLSEDEQA